MASIREEAIFNLKAVVQQTGLKPDTLRAWERRYGLPRPERSEGRHRLYSRRDIDTVRWLMARQREGLSISHAVELWGQIEASGQDPLRTEMPLGGRGASGPPPHVLGESLADLRKSWKSACLAYDEARAEQVMAQAFALYPPEVVAVEVLQETMAEIGEEWYQGESTVQQEHFCSELSMRRLEALLMAAPPPTRPGRLVAACPPDESHVLSLLLLTLLLRRQGWDVVYLGANVPLERVEPMLAATQPDLVILAAQGLRTAATLRDMACLLKEQGVPAAYGGLIFNREPALRNLVPGHFLGERLDLVPQRVEWLMTGPRPLQEAKPVPETYQQARAHFRARLGRIESDLFRALEGRGGQLQQQAMINHELAAGIEAALALGDMDYLNADVAWLEGLLQSREVDADSLRAFLEAYRLAAEAHLDDRGGPILAWLDKAVERE
jgi:DNA-binding transcriptional MerR regulator/methylmalonyl-CoA mutase cobalamin-binding subunit